MSKDEGELLRPEPSFPFSDCFHTIGEELHVRVKIQDKPGMRYKLAGSVRLPSDDHAKIEYGTAREELDNDCCFDSDADSLAPYERSFLSKYVRPSVEELNASNWGDPIVDVWLQLDENFSESCIPSNTRIIRKDMEEVQR